MITPATAGAATTTVGEVVHACRVPSAPG